MPRKVHGSLTTTLASPSGGIWITDTLLAETFQRFFNHSPRRYGSNVPGPLEARRRASKRKNTNLAHVAGGAGVVYDPAVMLGAKENNMWWKQGGGSAAATGRVIDEEKTGNFPFGSWMFRPPEVPKMEKKQTRTFDDVTNWEPPIVKTFEAEFEARIAHTLDVSTIQEIASAMNLTLSRQPKLSQIAFRHLTRVYEVQQQWGDLALLLCDPTLRSPGSGNHLGFIRSFCSVPRSRDIWQSVFTGLVQSIDLGLIPTADLQEIMLLVPEIHKTMFESMEYASADWQRILTAIERSSVARLEDLEPAFMTKWYAQMAVTERNDTALHLLWKFRQFSVLPDHECTSVFLIRRLKRLVKDESSSSETITELLSSLPEEERRQVILQATYMMITSARNNGSNLAKRMALQKWSSLLCQCWSGDTTSFPVTRSAWIKTKISYNDLTTPEQLITCIWIISRLCAQQPYLFNAFANAELRDEFESAFAEIEINASLDFLSHAICITDTLPLPDKDQLMIFLQHISRQKLMKVINHEEYQTFLQGISRHEYAQLSNKSLTTMLANRSPESLTSLAESTNTHLTQFHAMAQALILKGSQGCRIVKLLLLWNRELAFAIGQAWPSRLAQREPDTIDSGLNPATALSTLEKLTMAFAVTPTISDRAAFRHVYDQYLLLHRCGAPINPVIGRALWHAGVTRWGIEGAPTGQVIWCQNKVREIEGDDAANRLLWSAGFRKTFVTEFLHLLKDNPYVKETADTAVETGGAGTMDGEGLVEAENGPREKSHVNNKSYHRDAGSSNVNWSTFNGSLRR